MPKGIPQHGYPLPETIAPTKTRCVVFHIPDELHHIIAFWGAVGELGKWVNWQKEETKSGVLVANVWDTVIAKAREDYLAGVCGEPCEECEDCTCDKCQAMGGVSSDVGDTGYTIEELEELLAMAVTKLEYRADGLYYRDGCCDWYKVGGTQANVPTAGTSVSPVGMKEALAQGIENFLSETLEPAPHIEPTFNNEHTRKCVKATALGSVMRWHLESIAETIEEGGYSMAGILGAFSIITQAIPLVQFLAPPSALIALIAGYGTTAAKNAIDELLSDEELWADFACDYADVMTGAENFTGEDFSGFYDRWVLNVVGISQFLVEVLDIITPAELQKAVTLQVPTADCSCGEYLPSGYEVPIPEGTLEFNFVQFAEGKTWSQQPNYVGNGYESAFDGTRTGVLVNGRPKTQHNVSVNPDWEAMFAAHYHLSSPANISTLKVQWSFPDGEAGNKLQIYGFEVASQTWVWIDGAVEDNSSPYNTQATLNAANRDFSDFIVTLHTYWNYQGVQKHAHLVNILMAGTFNGVTFTELGVGEQFTP